MQMSNIKKEYKESLRNEKKETEIHFEKKYFDKLNSNFKNNSLKKIEKNDQKMKSFLKN
jgi:hypothetical protein